MINIHRWHVLLTSEIIGKISRAFAYNNCESLHFKSRHFHFSPFYLHIIRPYLATLCRTVSGGDIHPTSGLLPWFPSLHRCVWLTSPAAAAWRWPAPCSAARCCWRCQRTTTPRGPGGDDGEGSHHCGVDCFQVEGCWSWMDTYDVLKNGGVVLFVETDWFGRWWVWMLREIWKVLCRVQRICYFRSWNRHLANPWNSSSQAMRDKRFIAPGGVLGWWFKASFELIKDEALVPSKENTSEVWTGMALDFVECLTFWWLCQEGKKKTMKFPDLSTFRWSPKDAEGEIVLFVHQNPSSSVFVGLGLMV